ncbi:MAG: hypothetical protein HP496_05865 [Nitrospira sp.]|nr:hypothetical protein [Nitrospira sp.]
MAERTRDYFKGCRRVSEKRMLGGLYFRLNGHMRCGIEKDCLMFRVLPDHYEALLKKPHALKMDLTGKRLKGRSD